MIAEKALCKVWVHMLFVISTRQKPSEAFQLKMSLTEMRLIGKEPVDGKDLSGVHLTYSTTP